MLIASVVVLAVPGGTSDEAILVMGTVLGNERMLLVKQKGLEL